MRARRRGMEYDYRLQTLHDVTGKATVLVFEEANASTFSRRQATLTMAWIPYEVAINGKPPEHRFQLFVRDAYVLPARLLIQFENAAEDSRVELRHVLATRTPESLAECILRFVVSHPDCDAIIGDLDEEYSSIIVPQFGLRRARFWYFNQVVRSCGPLLKRRLWGLVVEVLRRAI